MEIKVYNNNKPEVSEVINLYLDAGWGTKNDYLGSEKVYENAIKNSNMITAYNSNNSLVGFIRFLSDFSHDTQILEFIVDKKYQNNGIGAKLLKKLIEDFGNTSIYINSTEIATDFLMNNNFKKHKLIGMSYGVNDK